MDWEEMILERQAWIEAWEDGCLDDPADFNNWWDEILAEDFEEA